MDSRSQLANTSNKMAAITEVVPAANALLAAEPDKIWSTIITTTRNTARLAGNPKPVTNAPLETATTQTAKIVQKADSVNFKCRARLLARCSASATSAASAARMPYCQPWMVIA